MKYDNSQKKGKVVIKGIATGVGTVVIGLALVVLIIYGSGSKISLEHGISIEKNNNIGKEVGGQEVDVRLQTPDATEAATVVPTDTQLLQSSNRAIRAVYVNMLTVNSSANFRKLLELIEDTKINAIVIDVKDDAGKLPFDLNVEQAKKMKAIRNESYQLQDALLQAKEKGVYTIARMNVFNDGVLARSDEALCIKGVDGQVIVDEEEKTWVNPVNEAVQAYELSIIKAALQIGFDEVQLDYVHFNNDVCFDGAEYGLQGSKADAINAFVQKAQNTASEESGKLSVCIEGDILLDQAKAEETGQNFAKLATLVDYICPIFYPSSFEYGAFSIKDPDFYPKEVVTRAVEVVKEQLRQEENGLRATVRPWLQGFTANNLEQHRTYGDKEVQAQYKALENMQVTSYVIYNPNTDYMKAWFLSSE